MTIGHRHLALRHLAAARLIDNTSKDREVATAQVHATLALEKQALIANLIAVTRDDDYLSQVHQMQDGPLVAIREGLGI